MKRNLIRTLVFGACLLTWTTLLSGAESVAERLFIHPLFSDHLVLQRNCAVPARGWAASGSKVSVSFAGQTRSAVAEPDGKWIVRLKAPIASAL
jgi:sialate O-acetylesterase